MTTSYPHTRLKTDTIPDRLDAYLEGRNPHARRVQCLCLRFAVRTLQRAFLGHKDEEAFRGYLKAADRVLKLRCARRACESLERILVGLILPTDGATYSDGERRLRGRVYSVLRPADMQTAPYKAHKIALDLFEGDPIGRRQQVRYEHRLLTSLLYS